jgi:superoxide dismutase, Fe-Mn family
MAFKLPPLPYATDALTPFMSKETLEYHYGRHHRDYVTKLNKELEKNPKLEKLSLEEIILTSEGPVFNNAAQIWNHTFFWNCLTPQGGGLGGSLENTLTRVFGSVEKFKTEFTSKAAALFGSGYAWLIKDENGVLKIETTKDAQNPLTKKQKPLLTCDVWEHAYYIDYRNERAKYLEAFWKIVNWDFVEGQLQGTAEPVAVAHA